MNEPRFGANDARRHFYRLADVPESERHAAAKWLLWALAAYLGFDLFGLPFIVPAFVAVVTGVITTYALGSLRPLRAFIVAHAALLAMLVLSARTTEALVVFGAALAVVLVRRRLLVLAPAAVAAFALLNSSFDLDAYNQTPAGITANLIAYLYALALVSCAWTIWKLRGATAHEAVDRSFPAPPPPPSPAAPLSVADWESRNRG